MYRHFLAEGSAGKMEKSPSIKISTVSYFASYEIKMKSFGMLSANSRGKVLYKRFSSPSNLVRSRHDARLGAQPSIEALPRSFETASSSKVTGSFREANGYTSR
jgi:hypothetical protein